MASKSECNFYEQQRSPAGQRESDPTRPKKPRTLTAKLAVAAAIVTTALARPKKNVNWLRIGSLTRTKALLLAALHVWELKHRIGE